MRIAIVGSGVSGLVSAWLLSRAHEVTLFEKDDRLGGHTHTHRVTRPDGAWPVDTGFIVFNERSYPNLTRILAQLGVAHRTLPCGTKVRILNPRTHRRITVRVIDRGPAAWTGRDFDLTWATRQRLGFGDVGRILWRTVR